MSGQLMLLLWKQIVKKHRKRDIFLSANQIVTLLADCSG